MSRLDAAEENISEPKYMAVESMKMKQKKSIKNTDTISELSDNFKQSNIDIIKILKKARVQKNYEKVMVKIFANLMKTINHRSKKTFYKNSE